MVPTLRTGKRKIIQLKTPPNDNSMPVMTQRRSRRASQSTKDFEEGGLGDSAIDSASNMHKILEQVQVTGDGSQGKAQVEAAMDSSRFGPINLPQADPLLRHRAQSLQ